MAKLDNLTQYIQEKLIENGLDKRVNVIHLSDHGMSSVSPPNFINLMDFVANNSCKMYGSSPVVQIVPNDASKHEYSLLNRAINEVFLTNHSFQPTKMKFLRI